MQNKYAQGARYALLKLGLDLQPEDLPDFLRKQRIEHLKKLYELNAATGFPAGGLIPETDNV